MGRPRPAQQLRPALLVEQVAGDRPAERGAGGGRAGQLVAHHDGARRTVASRPADAQRCRRRAWRGRRRAASSRRPARPGTPARRRPPGGSAVLDASSRRSARRRRRPGTRPPGRPAPTWGSITSASSRSAMRSASPSRSRAAAATTTASTPSGRPGRRGCPCSPAAPRSAGRGARGPAGPGAAASRWRPAPPPGRSASVERRPGASRRSARSGTAAITRPSGVAEGRSLAEWTARSARPSSTAAWTSLTNTPLPPSSQIGTSRPRSPVVSIAHDLDLDAGSAVCSSAATWSACQRARARAAGGDPERRGHGLSSSIVEQVAERGHEAVAPGAARRVLEHDRGLVQQLGHQAPGHGLDQRRAVRSSRSSQPARGGARARPAARPRPARAAPRSAAPPRGPTWRPGSGRAPR